ncbi:MAG TPA: DUF4249 domain-containing protein [Cyclobacteriaceae bacterium]
MGRLKQFTKSFYLMLVIGVIAACKEPYQPPSSSVDIGYLVVDGFMNTSKNSATVKLSRTIGLSIGKSLPEELHALVSIESEAGDTFVLTEGEHGNYSSNQVIASEGSKYRLHIVTKDGKEYSSKLMSLKSSPTLDNVIWKAGPEGITIHVNAHDDTNQTHYYKWIYTETWEYTSTYLSFWKMEGGAPTYRKPEEYIYTCYKTARESQILITSTLRLNSDVVSDFPITTIPPGSQKLSHRYSILVEQRALDEDAYNYWQLLEKSTENLGGLFDPLPSQVTGNIYNEGDLSEPVLGYFSGGNVDEKRMTIAFSELPDDLKFYTAPQLNCVIDVLPASTITSTIGAKMLIEGSGQPVITQYTVSTPECVDCRVMGGVTTKPDFWP